MSWFSSSSVKKESVPTQAQFEQVEKQVDELKDVIASLQEKIASLALFPERGVRRPALSKNARVLMVETYLVIYRIELDRVLVLRVLDGRMDIEAEFIE